MLLRPSRSMCAWPSMRPGVTVRPLRSTTRVSGAVWAAMVSFPPTASMRSPAMAIACAMLKSRSTVMTFALLSIKSAERTARRAGTICPAEGGLVVSPVAAAVPATAPAFFKNSRRGIGLSLMVSPARAEVLFDAGRPNQLFVRTQFGNNILVHIGGRHRHRVDRELLEPVLHRWRGQHLHGRRMEFLDDLARCFGRHEHTVPDDQVRVRVAGIERGRDVG